DGTNKTPPAPPVPWKFVNSPRPDAPPPAINHASNNSPPSKSCSPDSVKTRMSCGGATLLGFRSASHGTNTARFTVTSSPQSTHNWYTSPGSQSIAGAMSVNRDPPGDDQRSDAPGGGHTCDVSPARVLVIQMSPP